MNNSKKKEILIQYKNGPDYRLIPATGSFGGLTPNGEIICNFFVEYREYPENLSIILEEGQVPRQEIKPENRKRKSIRELQAGIVMRPDIAKSVGEWLIQEANKALGMDAGQVTKH